MISHLPHLPKLLYIWREGEITKLIQIYLFLKTLGPDRPLLVITQLYFSELKAGCCKETLLGRFLFGGQGCEESHKASGC